MIYEEFEKEHKDIPYEHTIEGRKLYRKEIRVLTMKFKQALEKKYKIENHPKKDKLWEIAWERGHSSGYSEVELNYDEMIELIKGAIK